MALAGILVLEGFAGASASGSAREQVEREHGGNLPPSAHDIRCNGDASRGALGRGAATIFEMSTNDFAAFVAQLHVNSRHGPAQGAGDPTVNGYNVWPQGSATLVPGNKQYGGSKRTWQGEAVPVQKSRPDRHPSS